MPDTLQSTSTLQTEWDDIQKKLMPAKISLLAAHAEAILRGYAHTQPEKPLPTQVLDYCPTGIFKIGVWDDTGDVWHIFLLKQEAGAADFCSRYASTKAEFRASALGPPNLPEGESLKALGMAEVSYHSTKQPFRYDMHFGTIASVMGIANLVKRSLGEQNATLRTMSGLSDNLWPHILMCSQPVRLMTGEALPEQFLRYMPQGEQSTFIVELQRTDCNFKRKMVVYRKDAYWRAQDLVNIQKWFST